MASTTLYSLHRDQDPASENIPTKSKLITINLASSPLSIPDILTQIKRLEKRTFPKEEAMDFDVELKKRNTELIVVLDLEPPQEAVDFIIAEANRQPVKSLLPPLHSGDEESKKSAFMQGPAGSPETALVVAYILHARSAGASLLHKVCVAEKYRRQGIASSLLTNLKSKLEAQNCERIQLWVDWRRDAALELYRSVGFRRSDVVKDYYGKGRHGVRMVIDLNWVW